MFRKFEIGDKVLFPDVLDCTSAEVIDVRRFLFWHLYAVRYTYSTYNDVNRTVVEWVTSLRIVKIHDTESFKGGDL